MTRGLWLIATAFVAVVLGTPISVQAEPASPVESVPLTTPPRLLTPVELALPEGVTVSSPIDVLLTIDSTGLVTEVTLPVDYGEDRKSVV